MTVAGKSEEKSLNSSNSSKNDIEEQEEARIRILEENPHIPKDVLEFMPSLPVEKKIRKVTESLHYLVYLGVVFSNNKKTKH